MLILVLATVAATLLGGIVCCLAAVLLRGRLDEEEGLW